METEFSVSCAFDAVYLVNGAFMETARFRFDPHDVLYITVLPLEAHLLPYTVKIVLGMAQNNRDLAVCLKLENSYFIRLLPRYAYAYTPGRKPDAPIHKSGPCKFFDLVKAGNLIPARAMMTEALSGSVTDGDLAAFFDGFEYVVETDGRFFLVNADNAGLEFKFTLENGKIDNIEEV